RQGVGTPLVLREVEPRIEGIVIIAEGGDSPFVRDALTRAARAVLGLEAHMIQVLTMETK
ncbi:MAG: stage III sporulation protein AG, partial [Defluviitaleaceae bacterium]|nr:stage III sporulation protein AG [Defluviitaleaceae bacterium]